MVVNRVATKNGREGNDLDDVLREVLAKLISDRGWSETRAAAELGFTQRTFNRLMGGQGFKLEHVSVICASIETSPIDLLRAHPLYDDDTRSKIRFAKDALYDRFRTVLTGPEAHRVLENVSEQKRLGVFAICTETIDGILKVAKAARRQAIQETRTPARKRRRRN